LTWKLAIHSREEVASPPVDSEPPLADRTPDKGESFRKPFPPRSTSCRNGDNSS
jgi:hypothetical protein